MGSVRDRGEQPGLVQLHTGPDARPAEPVMRDVLSHEDLEPVPVEPHFEGPGERAGPDLGDARNPFRPPRHLGEQRERGGGRSVYDGLGLTEAVGLVGREARRPVDVRMAI
ncbi:hypothetical protein SSPO_097020 [Streptomyces antimycoticus]|uniref:Uncharacterized protein n=1 Tax=Streptomyces antimycoticus TaxID=68175 RepID=A0A499UYB8_9ACTN|nr:hypothetical protein SSPO_097020 [Streptomyces antimycoticus]